MERLELSNKFMNKQKRPALSLSKGFTLIELIVVISIIATLSGIILFSITQYINRGKDSNISGNLAVLVPAGEVFYNGNSNSYSNFCDPDINSVIKNTISQIPPNPDGDCRSDAITSTTNPAGVCCYVQPTNTQSWAACARKFSDNSKAYCVDSRGVKEEICNTSCNQNITVCPDGDPINNCPSQ